MVNEAEVAAALLEYCAAVDRRRAPGVAELFTAGATLELVSGRAMGRDEILAAFRSAFEDDGVTTTHMVARPEVISEGVGRVLLRAGLTVWRSTASSVQVGRGHYTAELVADNGRWLFDHMAVRLDGPLVEVPDADPDTQYRSGE